MLGNCSQCHFRFEREQGYFIGAIYFNYGATVVIAVAGYFLLHHALGLSLAAQLALWGAFSILFPLCTFRYGKSLWLAIDLFLDPEGPEDKSGR